MLNDNGIVIIESNSWLHLLQVKYMSDGMRMSANKLVLYLHNENSMGIIIVLVKIIN